MSQKARERNQDIHHLLLCLLAKTQDQNASLIAKQKTLTSSRNTSIRNWERQKETVMKLLESTMTSEKFVFSEDTHEQENQIQKLKNEKDKLRRFSHDQKLIIQKQEQLLANQTQPFLIFSDFNGKNKIQTQQKHKRNLNSILANQINNEEENIEKIKQDIERISIEIDKSLKSLQEIEKLNQEEQEKNETLKQKKSQIKETKNKKYQQNTQLNPSLSVNLRTMSKEDLIKIKNELTISCIGEKELIEKNKNLKERLNELQTITDEDLIGQENVTKPVLQENSEERTKLNFEIDSLKEALKQVDNQFLKIQDGIQKFSQFNPLESYFH